MRKYREEVADAIIKRAQVGCFLSEEWPGINEDPVGKTKDRIELVFGYMLLTGHYYGSKPAGRKSYTHIEFDYACLRYKELRRPHIAVFTPRPGSEADTELREEAERCIVHLEKHRKSLDGFHRQVQVSGHIPQFYADYHELRELAIRECYQWNGDTPMKAAKCRAEAAPKLILDDDQLGSLGRKTQTGQFHDILAEFTSEPNEPAVAVLVHGDEDAGQREFLMHLAAGSDLKDMLHSSPGGPPGAPFDESALIQWVAARPGVNPEPPVRDVSTLADRIALGLREQPVYFMLDGVHDLTGDLAAFVTFWEKLRQRLMQRHAEKKLPHRLIAVVADYQESLDGRAQHTCDPGGALDYSKLLALARLTKLTDRDVLVWLKDLNLGDPAARKQIAASVLKNVAGDHDPTPLRVFQRLRRKLQERAYHATR